MALTFLCLICDKLKMCHKKIILHFFCTTKLSQIGHQLFDFLILLRFVRDYVTKEKNCVILVWISILLSALLGVILAMWFLLDNSLLKTPFLYSKLNLEFSVKYGETVICFSCKNATWLIAKIYLIYICWFRKYPGKYVKCKIRSKGKVLKIWR